MKEMSARGRAMMSRWQKIASAPYGTYGERATRNAKRELALLASGINDKVYATATTATSEPVTVQYEMSVARRGEMTTAIKERTFKSAAALDRFVEQHAGNVVVLRYLAVEESR